MRDDIQEKRKLRKKELDRRRTEWRKTHRTLGGRIILYPEKDPEHVNARASKTYNWFWKHLQQDMQPQDIPGIIASLKENIRAEDDPKKIRMFRTMIGMAEDAFQLKRLEDIDKVDTELMLGPTPVYDAEEGVLYRKGQLFTMDYNEDESSILVRDTEGVIMDSLGSTDQKNTSDVSVLNTT